MGSGNAPAPDLDQTPELEAPLIASIMHIPPRISSEARGVYLHGDKESLTPAAMSGQPRI